MELMNCLTGYTYVTSRYCWDNVLRPEDWKKPDTRKWLDKLSRLKEQLANWKENLNQNLPEDGSSTDPLLFNNSTIYGNQGQSAASGFQAWRSLLLVFLMFKPTSASPLQQKSYSANITIFGDFSNHLNCTLQTSYELFLCYHDCDEDAVRRQTTNSSAVMDELKQLCEQQKEQMNTNLHYLKTCCNLNSSNLLLILTRKDNVTIRYLFNDNELTEQAISNFPSSIMYTQKEDQHISTAEYMVKIKTHVSQLLQNITEVLPPGTTTSLPTGTTTSLPPIPTGTATSLPTSTTNAIVAGTVIFILIFVAIIGIICYVISPAIFVAIICFAYFGKKTVRDSNTKVYYKRAAGTEADGEGDSSVIEVAENEDQVTSSD